MVVRALVSVPFAVPSEQAYRYLREPRNRPRWQSSLRAVRDVQGHGETGSSWVDVTWAGLQPAMVVTADEPDHRWGEEGRWRGVEADLELTFTPTVDGCLVTAAVTVRGPMVRALKPVLAPAIRSDLRRAARLA